MDEETAARLRKRAVLSASRKGFAEHREDLAHDALVSWLEGHGQHQTADQAVTDAIRGAFGRPGTPGFESRRAVERPTESMDALAHVPSHEISRDSSNDFERLIGAVQLEPVDRAVVCLAYVWGFKGREIAHLFGLTEGWASQRLKGIQSRLSQSVEVKELRPLEKKSEKVSPIPQRQSGGQGHSEAVPAKDGDCMELEASSGLAQSQSLEMEGYCEEGIPEWFA